MITHDLGVVAEIADEVIVMYAAEVVEQGSATTIFKHPQHPTHGASSARCRGSTPTSNAWCRSRASPRRCSTRRTAAASTRAAPT